MKAVPLTLLGLLLAAVSWAQPGPPPGMERMTPEQQARMQQLRVAFFSEQLALTPKEAEAFWPVMHAHEEALNAHRVAIRTAAVAVPSSDSEARELIGQMAVLRKAEVDLDTNFLLDLLPVLGPERVANLPRLEREFRMSIVEAAQNRANGATRPSGPPPPPVRH